MLALCSKEMVFLSCKAVDKLHFASERNTISMFQSWLLYKHHFNHSPKQSHSLPLFTRCVKIWEIYDICQPTLKTHALRNNFIPALVLVIETMVVTEKQFLPAWNLHFRGGGARVECMFIWEGGGVIDNKNTKWVFSYIYGNGIDGESIT